METRQLDTRNLDKRQLIDAIRQYNVTAQPQFLEQFEAPALQQYLEHLESAYQKRLKFAGLAHPAPRLRNAS